MRYARPAAVGVIIAALSACSPNDTTNSATGDGPATATILTTTTLTSTTLDTTTLDTTTRSTSTAPPSTPATPATPATDPPATAPADPTPVDPPALTTELVVSINRPVDLAVRPGDDALWIVSQSGQLTRVTDSSQLALDVSAEISTRNEQGLLGVVFDPSGMLAYVNLTNADGTTEIREYGVTEDSRLDPATMRLVLSVPQPFDNHNAGDLEFGPDGLLYIPLGDGGSGGDPRRVSHDPTSLLGSVLRIDPTPNGDQAYTIPADNPFADGPLGEQPGMPEVWSWGLRNPWRIDIDDATGDLWIADVGQNEFEEINRLVASNERPAGFAADFGWSAFEGTSRFNDDVPDTGATVQPVLTYAHGDDGCSISGGVVYRGSAIESLRSAYVYSDFCSGFVWALDLAGGQNLTLLSGLDQVAAVRNGPDGELYVLQRSGDVLRVVQA